MTDLSKVPEVTKEDIRTADMNKDMIEQAILTARTGITKYQIEREIAQYIKQHFDRKYYPNWHCIVGKNYASVISYQSRHYINFSVGELNVMLFKYG